MAKVKKTKVEENKKLLKAMSDKKKQKKKDIELEESEKYVDKELSRTFNCTKCNFRVTMFGNVKGPELCSKCQKLQNTNSKTLF